MCSDFKKQFWKPATSPRRTWLTAFPPNQEATGFLAFILAGCASVRVRKNGKPFLPGLQKSMGAQPVNHSHE
jgi:hypothetical protein